jgi:hypothetical protein
LAFLTAGVKNQEVVATLAVSNRRLLAVMERLPVVGVLVMEALAVKVHVEQTTPGKRRRRAGAPVVELLAGVGKYV